MAHAIPFDHHRRCQHLMYSLTCDEFDTLWRHTEGRCWRCDVHESETKTNRLAVDHDQEGTLVSVRGLLCDSCNQYLASMDEGTRPYDEAAIRYLGMMAWVSPAVVARSAVARARRNVAIRLDRQGRGRIARESAA